MKYIFAIFIFLFPLLVGSACDTEMLIQESSNRQNIDDKNDDPMSTKIRIKIGNQTFTATLLKNASANSFKGILPLAVKMTELNGNEKYYRLPKSLPTNASNPGTINNGDLMLWGSNTVVLFYKTFPTSYSYTQLGKIGNPTGLAPALGADNVTVSFELD